MERPVVEPSAVSKPLRQEVEKGKMNAVEKARDATCCRNVSRAAGRPQTKTKISGQPIQFRFGQYQLVAVEKLKLATDNSPSAAVDWCPQS
jgi:hypothetical protein